jgi:hypothetical protein
MSTRAVYTFIDTDGDKFHVYKHHDGYPSGAAEWIANALPHAWELPRFEADEFGAAFIAGNKSDAGGVRLTHGPEKHGDLEYRYEISLGGSELIVKCFAVTGFSGPKKSKKIFEGTLKEFTEWAYKRNG